MNILIIGAGKLGLPLATQLNAMGHTITTLSKNPKQVDNGINHICQDVHLLTEHTFENYQFDMAYIILTPYQRDVFGYANAYVNSIYPISQALKNQPIWRLIYVSSTQVFGQDNGEWVNDDTMPNPNTDYGKILYSAELLWQAFYQEQLTIVRPSGLIGDDNSFLLKLAENLTDTGECRYVNFIKRSDVITLLALLANDNLKIEKSYIANGLTIIRHQLLNTIRQNNCLEKITIGDNLIITGKQLQANRMNALFENHQINLTPII